jgi:hypothetical protein
MKQTALLALLLGLAACGGVTDARLADPGCRAAVYDDPEVRTRLRQTSNPNANAGNFSALEEAKDAAYARCIGGAKAGHGGVERVK